ncbi:MAG: hypothetical protein FJZ92_00330 [Chloroflexi bacterium]|nr:hypothetical protein [Chloroflexota bacterium]
MAPERFDLEPALAENARVRADLLAVLARVPEDRRASVAHGTWRAHDVVAHFAGAQGGYAEALEHIARGEPPAITDYGPPGPPHDWDARVVARSAGRGWRQLLTDLDAARVRHEAAARACGARLADDERACFFAVNLARHESGHTDALARWLALEEAPRAPSGDA